MNKPISPSRQISGFIAKFDPIMARRIRSIRRALCRRFPTAIELVYDNYNFFVIGYSATERASDSVVSLAANANGVGLAFPYCGAKLPDPHRILLGSGSQNRFIRLSNAATLAEPAVDRLLQAAVRLMKNRLPRTGGGYAVIKSISAKQRPRRKQA